MQKIDPSDVKNMMDYERAREAMRDRIIALKKHRRVPVGESLTFLFENRDTVLFQIQEMIRTERIVEADRVRGEIDTYNALIPDPGELSATLFIEIPDLARLSPEEVRRAVNRFLGLDQGGVTLEIGDTTIPARFEPGHSKEEKMAAVHYLRFALPPPARAALGDPEQRVRLVVDHPRYRAQQDVAAEVRAEMLKDITA